MGHGITNSDRYGEVRKNGQRAWHGLGLEIEEGLTCQEGFEKIGLGWRTLLAPMTADIGPAWSVPVTGYMAHVRADDHAVLGIVSDRYKPFENMDLARFADALAGADGGVTIETGGSLYGGRRVFALVKLPEVVRATAEDVLDMYVLLSNGHGGFAAWAVYPTGIRVCCANTLRWSERDIGKGIKFRHTGDFDEKVKQARLALGIARRETEKFQEQVSMLVRTNMAPAAVEKYMHETWEKCFGRINPESMEKDEVEKLTAKKNATVDEWMANFRNERQTMKGIEGTAWAAYNAVSEWHDHSRGRYRDVGESDARVASNLFGVSQAAKLRAFRSALALVN